VVPKRLRREVSQLVRSLEKLRSSYLYVHTLEPILELDAGRVWLKVRCVTSGEQGIRSCEQLESVAQHGIHVVR
jgi:hypothetical protein